MQLVSSIKRISQSLAFSGLVATTAFFANTANALPGPGLPHHPGVIAPHRVAAPVVVVRPGNRVVRPHRVVRPRVYVPAPVYVAPRPRVVRRHGYYRAPVRPYRYYGAPVRRGPVSGPRP